MLLASCDETSELTNLRGGILNRQNIKLKIFDLEDKIPSCKAAIITHPIGLFTAHRPFLSRHILHPRPVQVCLNALSRLVIDSAPFGILLGKDG